MKGLKASSASDLKTKFGQLTEDMMDAKVDLSDIMPISGHPNIFRAKIVDESQRKLVLDKAKHLKGSAYDNVFLSRDLTYAQRADLYQRRQSRQAQNPFTSPSHASEAATTQGPNTAPAPATAGTLGAVAASGTTPAVLSDSPDATLAAPAAASAAVAPAATSASVNPAAAPVPASGASGQGN